LERCLADGKKRTDGDRDRLLVQAATRVIVQAAKKVLSFEAQQVTRNLKKCRERWLAAGASDEAKVAQVELKATQDLARIRGINVRTILVPRALGKRGLAPLAEGDRGTRPLKKHLLRAKERAKAPAASSEGAGGDADKISDASSESPSDNEGAADTAADGPEGCAKAAEAAEAAESTFSPDVEALLGRMMGHAAMRGAVESMDEAVTQRRREKLAVAEGRPLPRKQKLSDDAPAKSMSGGASYERPVVNHRAARTTFLTSLSGDVEDDIFSPGSDDDDDVEVCGPRGRVGRTTHCCYCAFIGMCNSAYPQLHSPT
jgi:hypothetical protein